MARVYSIVLLCIWIAVTQAEDADTQQLLTLTHRYTRDMATVMEDVKILLSRQSDKDTADPIASHTDFLPASCKEAVSLNAHNGLVTIFVPEYRDDMRSILAHRPLTVYCDQSTSDGGWLVLMRRVDKYEDFPRRLWSEYKDGFGNLKTSFWLGLEHMHQLTNNANSVTLRVELEDFEGNSRYVEYSYFRISSEEDGYRLFIDGYSGDAGDSLIYHSGQKFSTIDRDNDIHSAECTKTYSGAWWYKACVVASLTGDYLGGMHDKDHQGVYWRGWKGENYSYKRAEMKIRPNSYF